VSKLNSLSFIQTKFGLQGGNYIERQQMPLQNTIWFATIIVSLL